MKVFKRLAAMVLAMLMIVSTLGVGMTSYATIDTTPKNALPVTIVVPETVYLLPGGTQMQYFYAGNITNPTAEKTTEGYYSFSIDGGKQASSISVSVTAYSGGGLNANLSPTSADHSSILSGTLSDGYMPTPSNDMLVWTFSYVVEGVAFTSTAYSYVYAPYLGQTGSHGNVTYKTFIGNEPKLNVYSFLVGIHSTDGGPYASKFLTTSGYTMSPLVPGWSNGNVPPSNDDDNFALVGIIPTYFEESAHGGITHVQEGRDRGDGSGSNHIFAYGNTKGYGVLTLDSSRFKGAKFSDVPNFAAGLMIFGNEHAGENHRLSVFEMSPESANSGASKVTFNTGFDYDSGAKGLAYGLYPPSDTPLPANDTDYAVEADYIMRRASSESSRMYYTFGFRLRYVNKTTLRKEVNSAVNVNYQAADYDTATYNAFADALRNAALILGKPDVTQAQITSATATLLEKKQALPATLKAYTVTVTHKLPVSEHFTYTYDDNTYTEQNGYITIVETKGFTAGSNVTYGPNGYPGFTISETEQTVKNVHEDINVTYTYSPVKSRITFNYVDPAYVTDPSVTQMEVSYAQPYGTFPKPTMDGWQFNGWFKSGTTERVLGTTVCTMIGETLNLTANWTCYFSDGHGTASSPFLISSMTDFDNIDNVSVYCINNGANGTAGKYYKQTADIVYSSNGCAVQAFGGEYNGMNNLLTVPAEQTITSADYGSVFGTVTGGTIRDLNVDLRGSLSATGSSGSTGFIGVAQQDTIISNVQIVFNGSTSAGVSSGILVGKTSNTEINNCSVDLQSGTVGGDAFVGNTTGGLSKSNTWVLVGAGVNASHVSSNNVMRSRDNIASLTMRYRNLRYEFTATPASGWSVEYRDAQEQTIWDESTVYQAPLTETGKEYYACAVKTVTFAAAANGRLDGAGVYTLRQGQVVTGLKPVPNRGYRFRGADGGWTIERTNGTIAAANDGTYTFTMNSLGGKVTAGFSLNQYKVTYDANDGPTSSVPAASWYDSDKTITILAPSEISGWTFSGWNTASDGSGTFYTAGKTYPALSVEEDGAEIILYALWNQDTYTATFDAKGGTASDGQTVTYGGTITFPNSVKEGYYLEGWKTESGDGPYLAGETRALYSTTKYIASWKPISYTVVFSADGASNVHDPVVVEYNGGDLRLTEAYKPEKAGYTFLGWNTRADGEGTGYLVPGVFPGNQTTQDGTVIYLYARWQPKTFKITWNLNGGNLGGDTPLLESHVVFQGNYSIPKDSYDNPVIPEMDTKVFRGWYLPDGTQVTDKTVVRCVEDTIVSAQWDPAQYIIRYDGNGGTGSVADQTVTYGSGTLVFAENTFVRDGFSFAGWKTKDENGVFSTITYQPGMTAAGDLTGTNGEVVTLYAQWKGNTFRIVYDMHGFGTFSATQNVQMHADEDRYNLDLYNSDKKALRNVVNTQEDGSVIVKGNKLWLAGFAYTAADEEAMNIAYYGGGDFFLTDSELRKCDRDASGAIKLHVIWKRANTITWDTMGGTFNDEPTVPSTTVIRGERFVLPVGIMKKGFFIFSQWWTEPDSGAGVMVTNETVLNKNVDLTMYAHWESSGTISAKYETEYYEQDTSGRYLSTPTRKIENYATVGSEPITVSPDTTVPLGFTLDPAYEVPSCTLTNDPNQDVPVMRVYFKRNMYHVEFDPGDGEGWIDPMDYLFEASKALTFNTDEMIKPGYSFKRWRMTLGGDPMYFLNGGLFSMSRQIVQYLTANNTDTITLVAEWDEGTYLLAYTDGFGRTVYSDNLAVGTDIPIPSDPELEGYEFLDWDWPQEIAETFTMPSHPVEIPATWEKLSYRLYYTDGFGTTLLSRSVPYGDPLPKPAENPTATGYTFTGWDKTYLTMPAMVVEINATWVAQRYMLTLTDGHGKTLFRQEFAYQETIPPIDDPTTEGRDFDGWSESIPLTMPAEHKEIEATWIDRSYTVVFYDGLGQNGYGTELSRMRVKYGKTISVPSYPTSTEYLCIGWSDDIPATMPANDLEFIALWEPNRFRLTYVDGFGGIISSAEYAFGEPVEVPDADSLDNLVDGYSFNGWDGSVTTMPAMNTTITAKWQPKTYKIHYLTEESDQCTGSMDAQEVTYKGIATLLQNNYSRTGYTFNRWREAETGNTFREESSYAMAAPKDVQMIATWTPNTYNIEFRRGDQAAGGDMSSMRDCRYDEVIELARNEFTLAGSQFVGWSVSGSNEVLPDQDAVSKMTDVNGATITLTAVWERATYTISYDMGNGTADAALPVQNAQYTNTVTLAAPVNAKVQTASETRTFLGWTTDGLTFEAGGSYTMPSKNVTMHAVWSANYHELDELTTRINNYRRTGILSASDRKDPGYAAGGDFAVLLGSDGTYPWNNFDTDALNNSYYAALNTDRSVPADRQSDVDAVTQGLQNALDSVELLPVDYYVSYPCMHYEESAYIESAEEYFPYCSEDYCHTFNDLLDLIDELLDEDPANSEYTTTSLSKLRRTVYGGGRVTGIVTEVNIADLKIPAQSQLEYYVDLLAEAYHSTPVLKSADYSQFDALITDYLPRTKGVAYNDLLSYYESDGVMALRSYYTSVDRTLSTLDQYLIDEEIIPEMQYIIDEELQALRADYRSLYSLILTIPRSDSFAYPSASTNDTIWDTWAIENAGAISEAIDKEFLDARYEENTVQNLYALLDDIDWELDVFHQDEISSKSGTSYASRLQSAINTLVVRTFTVTYWWNDSTGRYYVPYSGQRIGNTIQKPLTNPSRSGYDFICWSYDADEAVPMKDSDLVTGPMDFYAIWDYKCLTIHFDMNSGNGTRPDDQQIEIGKTENLPQGEDFEKEGFVFIGWAEDPYATEGVLSMTAVEKKEIILYAIWAPAYVDLIAREGSTTVIDRENMLVYGLDFKLREQTLLSDYLDVQGNGTIHVVSYGAYVSTGTQIQVTNNYTGEKKEYTVVLFGDVNGDGLMNTEDITWIRGHVTGASEIVDEARLMAGDLNGNGRLEIEDTTYMKGIINGVQGYNQAEHHLL